MPDDPSVLGNLPRSRPGRRSDKRTGAKPAAATKTAASEPARAKAKAKPAARKPQAAAPRAERPRAGGSAADPVTGAIRLAGQVAGAGFKVAGEVLKRFPGRR